MTLFDEVKEDIVTACVLKDPVGCLVAMRNNKIIAFLKKQISNLNVNELKIPEEMFHIVKKEILEL